MARRRLQQKGDLRDNGAFWTLRWREDHIAADGTVQRGWSQTVWLGPSTGAQKLTEKQAQRIAWENFLSRLDQNNRVPQSIMTVREFVERKFQPEHIDQLKPKGVQHYETILKLVLPEIGDLRLRDVTSDDIQKLVSSIRRRKYPILGHIDKETGRRTIKGYRQYSGQTAKHVRNVVSAIFRHAKAKQWYVGDNPAAIITIREVQRKELHALTLDQARQVLQALPQPSKDMAFFALLTSMNIAEICGLKWKYVNLGDEWTTVDGEAIPPHTIAVRGQWTLGQYGSLKTGTRKRDLPIPPVLEPVLLARKDLLTQPEHYVFRGSTGKPVDAHNEFNRRLKPVGRSLDMPWLGWHVFRRAHTTLAKQLGMSLEDRIASMGHGDARMTLAYTQDDLDRRRETLEALGRQLIDTGGRVQ